MKSSKEKNEEGVPTKKLYGFKISEDFYKKIDRHIRILKCSQERQDQSKGKWYTHAIQEKLENEKNPSFDTYPKQKHLNIYLEGEIIEKLEKRIENIKKFRAFYSRKEWISEAIQEKINREEVETKKILKEIEDY